MDDDIVTSAEILDYMDINPAELARCRDCNRPMYCIYESGVREFCYECMLIHVLQNAQDIKGGKR